MGIDAYYHTHSFAILLNPFLKASDSSMRIHAKLIMAYVSSVLTDEEIEESMCLAPSDASELLSTLGEATTSTNRKAGGFTVIELIRGLLRLLVCHENLNLIAKKSILPSVISVAHMLHTRARYVHDVSPKRGNALNTRNDFIRIY